MSLASDRAKPNAAGKPTLYKRIRLDIETRILTGEWPPGHRIPFEHQLMPRYRCSRMTVNKALSELAQADLIERRRRAGPRGRPRQAARHGGRAPRSNRGREQGSDRQRQRC